jgi:hypothetical protein
MICTAEALWNASCHSSVLRHGYGCLPAKTSLLYNVALAACNEGLLLPEAACAASAAASQCAHPRLLPYGVLPLGVSCQVVQQEAQRGRSGLMAYSSSRAARAEIVGSHAGPDLRKAIGV